MNRYNALPAWIPWTALIVLLIIASAAQSLIAYPIYRWCGAQPDLPLTIALCAALLSDAPTGALLGFFAGLLTASLVGETLGTYLVSRTLSGFVAGRFTTRLFQANLPVILIGVLSASLIATILQVLAAPPHHGLGAWIQATLGGAVWNVIVSIPIWALLRRAGWGGEDH